MTDDSEIRKIKKLIPHFVVLTFVFSSVYLMIASSNLASICFKNMPEYRFFIIINFLLSIYCTVMLLIGFLLKFLFKNMLLIIIAILLIFDIYVFIKDLFFGLKPSNLVVFYFTVLLSHSYLVLTLIRMNIKTGVEIVKNKPMSKFAILYSRVLKSTKLQ